jgi:hypothetical protein
MESLVVPHAWAFRLAALAFGSLATAASLGACGNEPGGASTADAEPPSIADAMSSPEASTDAVSTDAITDGGDAAPGEPATHMPIEVLGAPGTEVFVTIVLDDAQARASHALDLTLHNIIEPNCAELRVNGKVTLDLSASGGPFVSAVGDVRSARVPIDALGLRAGANRFSFRYTRQVQDLAAVSGFRVLAMAVIAGDRAIAPDLPSDVPSAWAPIRSDADSLERGRRYFQETSRDGGPPCARCHADSGADLQYYGFSNRSISRRAMFHLFTAEEADDMASYIRSLPVAVTGRPYDPPLQPGRDNHGAAGAGYAAILPNDEAFAKAAFGGAALSPDMPWNFAENADPFRLPTRAAAPTWMRWLPRDLPDLWFARLGGALPRAEQVLQTTPTLSSAQSFMSAALAVAKDVLIETGDYDAKINILRFAAVKLWDWSRKNGFAASDHGVPDQSPAYPYEVGFAFFEAAQAGIVSIPDPWGQSASWWWAQLASYPGRGYSTGKRPLNFQDVLTVAEMANLGPAHLAFLHLYGSWEESRGALAAQWGTAEGPVRLLETPMRALPAADRVAIVRRFFAREAEFLAAGGVLTNEHHRALAQAWTAGCDALSLDQRADVRRVAPKEVIKDLEACPEARNMLPRK